MRKNVVICGLILAYCLAVSAMMYRSLYPLAAQATLLPTPQVAGKANVRFARSTDSPDPNQLLTLVNQVRQASGAKRLHANEKLGDVAAIRAADMVKRQYYAHQNPDGTYYYDLFANHDIHVDYSCENLDLTFEADAHAFINQWLASDKGHRQCLLDADVTEAGYAIVKMDVIQHDGHSATAYLAVAIHATATN